MKRVFVSVAIVIVAVGLAYLYRIYTLIDALPH